MVVSEVCETLTFLLDNIYVRFGTKLFRQIVGIPMGTNCAPLVADLFLFCYERDFMMSLSEEKQSEIIEAFSSTSRYLDTCIYPSQIQLNKANSSETGAQFLDLHLFMSERFISCKLYDKKR